MADETLSPRQAKQIVTQFGMIINQATKNIEKGFTDFFTTMRQEWEDKYAVDLANELKNKMTEVTTHLQDNCNVFVETINNISQGYAQTGGMSVSAIDNVKVGSYSVEANVKDTFDGDVFGFKNVDSYSKIAEAITNLVKTLQNTISETSSSIKGINAFGNQQVLSNLATSGGEIIRILQEAVQQVENITKQNLQDAADAYRKTGSSAVTAANIQTK